MGIVSCHPKTDFQPPHWHPKSGVAHLVWGSTIPAAARWCCWQGHSSVLVKRTRLLPITKMTNSIACETWLQFHWWRQPRPVAFISAILDIDLVLLPTELDLRLESNPWSNSYNFNHRPKENQMTLHPTNSLDFCWEVEYGTSSGDWNVNKIINGLNTLFLQLVHVRNQRLKK